MLLIFVAVSDQVCHRSIGSDSCLSTNAGDHAVAAKKLRLKLAADRRLACIALFGFAHSVNDRALARPIRLI